jgi:hypothetical protein
MQDLRVIGVESGALLVATDGGSEYRLPVTHSLHTHLRAAAPDGSPAERKAPPREIQAHIRAGLTSEQVSAATGADLAYIRRFEGPVLAERAFVLETALSVPVTVADATESDSGSSTFGGVIEARLDSAEASEREWSSYKDVEQGWVVHVSYVTREVARDATWRFDPKKLLLAPSGGDAHTLSQHREDVGPLAPRLRAVDREPVTTSGRFDSGAFVVDVAPEPEIEPEVARAPEPDRQRGDTRSPAAVAATNRAPDPASSHNQTADLLEALRRRRGERESARFSDDDAAAHPSAGSIRIIDVPLDDFGLPEGSTDAASEPSRDDAPDTVAAPPYPIAGGPRSGRPRRPGAIPPVTPLPAGGKKGRGRASMPSWDEIVFGARTDDDQ